MEWKQLLLLLCVHASNQVHPCHSMVGQTSEICQQLFKHCGTYNGKETPICQNLDKEDNEKEDEQDRFDKQGTSSVLDPVIDIYSENTVGLANTLHPHQILWTLYSIPTDLLGFYENFAKGVRRGFNDIVSKVSQGGSRLFNDINSLVPTSGYNSQKKADTENDSNDERKDTKQKVKDDPSSPYSINYSGGLKKKQNSGYSLTLTDKDGKKTGIYKYDTPDHSVRLSWPRHDQGGDWSVKHNEIENDKEYEAEIDTFKPHGKDNKMYTGLDYDVDDYGNIYLLSEEDEEVDDYYDRKTNNIVKDDYGYKSGLRSKPNPFLKEKKKSKYSQANMMVNLIKGTGNLQKPWVQRPPKQLYEPSLQNRWDVNPNKRRKTELKRNKEMGNGARRFDQFAPSSVERKDFAYRKQSQNTERYQSRPTNGHKMSDVNFVDYFYY